MIRGLALLAIVAFATNGAFARNIGSERAGCTANVNSFPENGQLLVLKPGQNQGNDAWFYPQSGDTITFEENESVLFACPGGNLRISGSNQAETQAEATCSDNQFTLLGKTVGFSSITCSRDPWHTARYSGNTCLGTYKEIEIGFELEDGWFVRVISVCFDDVHQNSLYSEFNLTKSIEGYQSGFPRPGFIEDDFYNVGSNSVDDLYSRDTQRATVNGLVGLSPTSTKYIQDNDYFLSRGHLTAKADFVFGSQHRATFHFVNVCPQWQTNNGANWNTLEMDTRSYVGSIDVDHIVYTGGTGVTTLPHETTGEEIPLYLYVDGAVPGLPVPAWYWKLVYEPVSQTGAVFVTLNNPYQDKPADFCTSICDQFSWLNWNPDNQVQGYSYCCDYNEVKDLIQELPELTVTGILGQ
jgi:hypothetical protein